MKNSSLLLMAGFSFAIISWLMPIHAKDMSLIQFGCIVISSIYLVGSYICKNIEDMDKKKEK